MTIKEGRLSSWISFKMATSLKIVLCFVLLGSAFSFNVRHTIKPSGWLKGSPFKPIDGHIYGGSEVEPNSYPHQTLVYTTLGDQQYICGGIVISSDFVMTAAHCPYGGASFEVLLGAHNRNVHEDTQAVRLGLVPELATIHADYDASVIANDIAVIQMVPSLSFTDAIQPIPLASAEPPVGTLVTLSGWGRTGDDFGQGVASTLNAAEVTIAEDKLCEDFYSGDQGMISVICLDPSLTGTSSCGGDSGGPMNWDTDRGKVVAGITSWGSSAGCSGGWPIGYTSVHFFLDWIERVTGVTP